MDKLLIRGGRSLRGTVPISGAKNAALPELCATLLTADPVRLRNVPRLQDVSTMLKLIDGILSPQEGTIHIHGVPVRQMARDALAEVSWNRPCDTTRSK